MFLFYRAPSGLSWLFAVPHREKVVLVMAEADLSRRQFLNTAVGAVGAVITAIIGVPIAGYFIDPALRKGAGEGSWVKLKPLAELTDTPVQFVVSATKVDGFMKQNVNATVYAFQLNGEPVAMSNICTHLGCPASWDAGQNKFFCPCHGGVYAKDGTNVAGPPPRPLPRFATKVENGDLYVQVT